MSTTPESDRAALLRRVPLLAGIERVALARLAAQLEPLHVDAGQDLCRQGDPGDRLFIIVAGTCGVYVTEDRGEQRLTALGAGEHFGEIALLTDEPRTATVRAETAVDVLQLPRERFTRLVDSDPAIGRTLAGALARRLRIVLRPEGSELRTSSEWVDPSLPAGLVPRRRPATMARRAVLVAVMLALASGIAALAVPDVMVRFLLLSAAAGALWVAEPVPRSVTALGLVAAWVALGVATPARALAGFASPTWAFIVSILGLAAVIARSGLLVRGGVLLIQRMPPSVHAQALALTATGAALGPILPSRVGRTGLLSPIAISVVEALGLRERGGASAFVGLATWLGSADLYFAVVNGSSNVLLTWALLPDASRARYDWIGWLVAAAPLALLVGIGSFLAFGLVFRPEAPARPSRERLRLALQVLGPLSRAELAVLAIMALTVVGWILGPARGLDPGVVAVAGFVAAAAATRADIRTIGGLDWDYILFYGVVLTLAGLARSVEVDRVIGGALGNAFLAVGLSGVALIPAVAILTALMRMVLNDDQTVLILGLTLIPLATALGVEPWTIGIAILAMSPFWFVTAQSPVYLVAYATSEGRLYSHAQARRAALVYAGVVLAALLLVLPYWRWTGVL